MLGINVPKAVPDEIESATRPVTWLIRPTGHCHWPVDLVDKIYHAGGGGD